MHSILVLVKVIIKTTKNMPQYIAATQGVVIECEGKKVERWRVHEEEFPDWSSFCRLLWLLADVRVLRH